MSQTSLPKPRHLLVLAVALSLGLLTACLGAPQSQVLSELNGDRTANHLRALGTQADAQRKAQAWAEKLARENKLYHSNLPDGINVKWCSIGENVGYGPSVPAVEDAYMNSPGHKANILNTKWNGAGVGFAKNGNRVYTVQVFIKTC
ncbi:CAP domain-containing protein [Aquihabitans sp. McL0605]|uniref:CAP domain-containing protein n=1 Tax=Aquihabitans sp. McL0605 TaxID=3415671 RepID=UPI003CF0534A